jgi:DNA end-binding protein Ku
VARYVFRNRQQLGCVRVRDGVLTLEKMHLADEIRPTKGIAPTGVKVEKQELELAHGLIDRLAGDFDPGKYEDTYRGKLLAVIRAKGRGKEIQAVPSEEPEPPADLMEALRQSVEASGRRRSRARPRPRGRRRRSRTTARKH